MSTLTPKVVTMFVKVFTAPIKTWTWHLPHRNNNNKPLETPKQQSQTHLAWRPELIVNTERCHCQEPWSWPWEKIINIRTYLVLSHPRVGLQLQSNTSKRSALPSQSSLLFTHSSRFEWSTNSKKEKARGYFRMVRRLPSPAAPRLAPPAVATLGSGYTPTGKR